MFITTGAMNMDMSVRSSDSKSTAGSVSRTGVNFKVVLGPWVRALPDDSVVFTIDGGDVAYDSVLSTCFGTSSIYIRTRFVIAKCKTPFVI